MSSDRHKFGSQRVIENCACSEVKTLLVANVSCAFVRKIGLYKITVLILKWHQVDLCDLSGPQRIFAEVKAKKLLGTKTLVNIGRLTRVHLPPQKTKHIQNLNPIGGAKICSSNSEWTNFSTSTAFCLQSHSFKMDGASQVEKQRGTLTWVSLTKLHVSLLFNLFASFFPLFSPQSSLSTFLLRLLLLISQRSLTNPLWSHDRNNSLRRSAPIEMRVNFSSSQTLPIRRGQGWSSCCQKVFPWNIQEALSSCGATVITVDLILNFLVNDSVRYRRAPKAPRSAYSSHSGVFWLELVFFSIQTSEDALSSSEHNVGQSLPDNSASCLDFDIFCFPRKRTKRQNGEGWAAHMRRCRQTQITRNELQNPRQGASGNWHFAFFVLGHYSRILTPISASRISEPMIGPKDSYAANCVYHLLVSGLVFALCVPKH